MAPERMTITDTYAPARHARAYDFEGLLSDWWANHGAGAFHADRFALRDCDRPNQDSIEFDGVVVLVTVHDERDPRTAFAVHDATTGRRLYQGSWDDDQTVIALTRATQLTSESATGIARGEETRGPDHRS